MPRWTGALDPRGWWARALSVVLLVAALVIPIVIMRGKSATSDEVAHLPAGYSYLTTGIFKINPMHPPLVKELCAIPLLFFRPAMPLDRQTLATAELPLAYQWEFGKQFLFTQDANRLLFWGRVPAVLLSVGLATVVLVWAGRLWGATGGLLALALYVFDPTVTAHAQLVTTDVGVAFFATLFLFLLRRYLAAPSWRGLVLSGLTLGLALGAKFSAVLLVPMTVLLVGLAAWHGREAPAGARSRRPRRRPAGAGASVMDPLAGADRSARLLCAAGALGLISVIAAGLVWAIYFFPTDPLFYVKAMQTVNKDHDPRYAYYLMGHYRREGWVHYLLVAWLIKTPLPSLLLLSASAVLFARGRRAAWLDEAFLLVPAVGFFVGYSLSADNIGVRYLIPMFPFLFIFTARLAPALAGARRWAAGALALLLVWQVLEFARIWPDHLSYFNQIAGGPDRGVEWLDDSNVDWGQGLIQLRNYLTARGVDEYRLCYFGSADPAYYRIRDAPLLLPPRPGTVILSAHCMVRVLGAERRRWPVGLAPRAVVGHAYYVFDIPPDGRSPAPSVEKGRGR